MANYDFVLDMDTDNSNSLILRNIKPNSVILEIGSAYGRMTKYLKEVLNCQVYIIEIDKEAGKIAAQYANHAWLGPEIGNVEYNYWLHDLCDMSDPNDCNKNLKFNYIIFADVLEHLIGSHDILISSLKLLKNDGSVFISIPNIGHNAVLVDLLQGKFEYRDSGILDRTHVKFFTHQSLKKFVAAAGLTIIKELNALNTLYNTEFSNSYEQLPLPIAEYLKQREHGEVYQFIWELKPISFEISIITPVYNKFNFTKSYLEDLLQLDQAKTEIIIIDNASTDETSAKLAEYQNRNSNLVVIRNEVNMGFGAASNAAYRQAKGKYILFLNNDIRVKDRFEDWTNLIIEKCHDNNMVSPTAGLVDENNDFQFIYETTDPTKSFNYLSGWCLAAQKTVFDKLMIGSDIFDNRFFCYFEDTDLSFRARQLDILLEMVNLPVVHFGKVSSKQLNTYSLYKNSRDIFISKWKK